MYVCEHFTIYELVDKETYEIWGDRAWMFLDPRALMVIDFLRKNFGKAFINDWKWNPRGSQWRGLRTRKTDVGAEYSSHRFGRAFDITFEDISAYEVREWLKENWTEQLCIEEFGFVISITIEEDVNWLHIDVRNADSLVNLVYP